MCFYGAHYVSFYRELDHKYYQKWKIYDDTHVKEFYDWNYVIKRCAETIMRPTILFYQRVIEVPSYIPKINNYDLREFESMIEKSLNFFGGMSREEIMEQEKLLESFKKNRGNTIQEENKI